MKILLIGQGIAGTLLACSLQKRGMEVHIAEGDLPGGSSPVAAGIINPVTGKRFVKSWRFDEFFPVAKRVYQDLAQKFGISVWDERPILRLLATPEEANDWSIRCGQPEYADFLGERADAGPWQPFVKPGFRFGLIHQAARIHFPALMAAFREKAQRDGVLLSREIRYSDEWFSTYDRVVFCEGWRAQSNPFFPNIPFRLAKGEALLIRLPLSATGNSAVFPEEMLKKTITLVPMGDGIFWAGGTYQWHFPDLLPSAGERDFLLRHLHDMLGQPFEIVDHIAGIRPTMIDRRPIVGRSKINPKAFILNGLGTKGALLAPFFAEQLAEEICSPHPHF